MKFIHAIIKTIKNCFAQMRTDKHKLKPLSPTQEKEFLELACAYQFEKNYWSDQLLKRQCSVSAKQLGAASQAVNLKNLHTYRQIRDSNNLTKNNYFSRYNLPVRYCTIALKEAYDLHIRTYESQIAFLKNKINNKIYQFKITENTPDQAAAEQQYNETKKDLTSLCETNNSKTAEPEPASQLNPTLYIFKEFLRFVTNSLFYNYQTFRTFEEEFYSKDFRKARIYKRIQPILQKLFQKAIEKEVFTLKSLSEAEAECNYEAATQASCAFALSIPSEDEAERSEFLQFCLRLEESVEIIKQFIAFEPTGSSGLLGSTVTLNRLLHYYCNYLVKAIVQFRNYKPIQSQINSTITLDGSCYKLYSKYDTEARKNRWFLDIMSMQVGKRIKGLELTGFHHAKKIMKHKKYANLVLSFNSTDMTYYAHFTFENKVKPHKVKRKSAVARAKVKAKQSINNVNVGELRRSGAALTMLTVGGDFGLTENFTFSDGWVSGCEQGKILSHIANSTKNSVACLQKQSKKGFFGVEKNNKVGKRNHKNNCFNHNELLGNINKNYRKKQQKHNRFLQNYKYLLVNEIIDHFTSDSIYGQYSNGNGNASEAATHEHPIELVFESLDYTSLGRNKENKRQINLIKGILNVLEEKINKYNLPIKIIYVNPAYTSQACPNCSFVAKTNRDSKAGKFRCQHCGFSAIDDEKYQVLTRRIPREHLPSEDDFIAACNIAARPSAIPDSMKLRVKDVKYRLMQKHESLKVFCKMFEQSNIKCC